MAPGFGRRTEIIALWLPAWQCARKKSRTGGQRRTKNNAYPEKRLEGRGGERDRLLRKYLNQLYFDALAFTPEALRHLVAQVGASQLVLGIDHPIPREEHPVDHVLATTTLSDKPKAAILGGNAAHLVGLKEARARKLVTARLSNDRGYQVQERNTAG
jgi:hypothetical protein